ncbi:MAG: methyltransferase domain-containing protein [Pseudomonadota bacterium]
MTNEQFGAFEREGWTQTGFSEAYHERFSALTQQSIAGLLDAAGVRPGHRVLDVATGPGYGAGAAAELGAEAIGVDFSPGQIALARTRYPEVQFEQGDAANLPFGDGQFDCVVSNFGILHFPDPEAFIGEAKRVLKPGGTLAYSAWEKAGVESGFGLVLSALASHGNLDVGLPSGPDFFQFADPEFCAACLAGHSYSNPITTSICLRWEVTSPQEVVTAISESTVRTAAMLARQTAPAKAAIEAMIIEGVEKAKDENGYSLAMPVALTAAQSP